MVFKKGSPKASIWIKYKGGQMPPINTLGESAL